LGRNDSECMFQAGENSVCMLHLLHLLLPVLIARDVRAPHDNYRLLIVNLRTGGAHGGGCCTAAYPQHSVLLALQDTLLSSAEPLQSTRHHRAAAAAAARVP
jgi:hypothetical protein